MPKDREQVPRRIVVHWNVPFVRCGSTPTSHSSSLTRLRRLHSSVLPRQRSCCMPVSPRAGGLLLNSYARLVAQPRCVVLFPLPPSPKLFSRCHYAPGWAAASCGTSSLPCGATHCHVGEPVWWQQRVTDDQPMARAGSCDSACS